MHGVLALIAWFTSTNCECICLCSWHLTLITGYLLLIQLRCFVAIKFSEPVWDVARCTSAAPVLFGQHGDFVDGGILANNPCECGLTQIQNFYRKRGKKLPISLVVSVGSGKYPKQQLGNIDAQQFLFCGPWFDLRGGSTGVRERTKNLFTMLTNAVSACMYLCCG